MEMHKIKFIFLKAIFLLTVLLPYGTRRFITMFTKSPHWTLSWVSRIQFALFIPLSLRTIFPLFKVPNIKFFPLLKSCQRIRPGRRRFETFRNKLSVYGEGLLAPRPTPKLKDHPLSAFRGCLFNIFAATLRIWGLPSIRNLRTRHAVVTRDPPNMEQDVW